MSGMTPDWLHNAHVGHSTPETTTKMTLDTQRPQVPLRGASIGGEVKERQKDMGMMKRGRTGDSSVVTNNLKWVAGDAS